MSLPQVNCTGSLTIDDITLFSECIRVRKIFDEFVLRECIEGIVLEVRDNPEGFNLAIEPMLILRNCSIINPSISDASINTEKRLRFAGRCCCQVFARDTNNNIIRLNVTSVPAGSSFSIGADGELCFNFNVRRAYPEATETEFDRLLHFVDQQSFALICLSEAIIDDENNQFTDGVLVTSLGMFVAIKFDAEVQLCIPVYGYCEIEEGTIDNGFCEDFGSVALPNFNPPQLNDLNNNG